MSGVAELEGERPASGESFPSSSAAVGQLSSPTRPAASGETISGEEVCERVGQFLRRSLEAGHRRTSSRDLLALQSRFWIVVRSIEGQVFDPPRVFSRFGACKALVKRGTEVGDSIFVGLPAYKDVGEDALAEDEAADEEVDGCSLYVYDGDSADVEYLVIFVCSIDERTLVAVPQSAWNRRAEGRAGGGRQFQSALSGNPGAEARPEDPGEGSACQVGYASHDGDHEGHEGKPVATDGEGEPAPDCSFELFESDSWAFSRLGPAFNEVCSPGRTRLSWFSRRWRPGLKETRTARPDMHTSKGSKGTKLEQALDGVSSGGASAEGGAVTSRKNSVARRALRQALHDSPEEIYHVVERLMLEDLLSTTLSPGMPRPTLSGRAWLENRSRLTNYQASVRTAWGVGGILDALIQGREKEARTRACLMLVQADQVALDRGQWGLAAEVSLEQQPPFHSFAAHSQADFSDQPLSRLLEPRWAEIFLHHLQDTENYMEKRKKLQKVKAQTADDGAEPTPKAKPKAKAKGGD
eukprot:s1427_g4.t1